jgi:hypothetical protein
MYHTTQREMPPAQHSYCARTTILKELTLARKSFYFIGFINFARLTVSLPLVPLNPQVPNGGLRNYPAPQVCNGHNDIVETCLNMNNSIILIFYHHPFLTFRIYFLVQDLSYLTGIKELVELFCPK